MGKAHALLVSIHDVSPVTLEASREAVKLANAAGVPTEALTVLVVPFHEQRVRLDQHAETCDWLAGLAGEGATLVWHGLTHRMAKGAWAPWAWPWGYGFARGQGELYRASAEDARRCLDEGRAILERAGLQAATAGFVPPAWLLSRAALAVVRAAGFAFYEVLGGIVRGDELLARKVIGWGSLSAVEALVTSQFAQWQAHGAATDTRLAIHPVDATRARSRASIGRVLPGLRDQLQALGYRQYLRAMTREDATNREARAC